MVPTDAITGNQFHPEVSELHIGALEIYIIQIGCIFHRCMKTVIKHNVTTDINFDIIYPDALIHWGIVKRGKSVGDIDDTE